MGEAIGNIGWHYSPANPLSCHQFHEGEGHSCLMVVFQIISLTIALISLVLGMLAIVLLAVISPLFCILYGAMACCACICCRTTSSNNTTNCIWTTWLFVGIFPVLLIFIPFYLVHVLLALVSCLIFSPFG